MAFVAPAAAVLGAAVGTGSPGGDAILASEWVRAAVASVVAAAALDGRVARLASRQHESARDSAVKPPT